MPRTAIEELVHQVAANRANELLKAFEKMTDQPELVRASELLTGDKFKELGDSRRDKPGRVKELQGPCRADPNCLHVKTSRGDWCIARDQFVVLVP